LLTLMIVQTPGIQVPLPRHRFARPDGKALRGDPCPERQCRRSRRKRSLAPATYDAFRMSFTRGSRAGMLIGWLEPSRTVASARRAMPCSGRGPGGRC